MDLQSGSIGLLGLRRLERGVVARQHDICPVGSRALRPEVDHRPEIAHRVNARHAGLGGPETSVLLDLRDPPGQGLVELFRSGRSGGLRPTVERLRRPNRIPVHPEHNHGSDQGHQRHDDAERLDPRPTSHRGIRSLFHNQSSRSTGN